jgi:hypothetical protein
VIRIGNNTPVEAFPPKIIAMTGTMIIETPGTPVFDIPTRIAHKAIRAQWLFDNEKIVIKPDIANNFLVWLDLTIFAKILKIVF